MHEITCLVDINPTTYEKEQLCQRILILVLTYLQGSLFNPKDFTRGEVCMKVTLNQIYA